MRNTWLRAVTYANPPQPAAGSGAPMVRGGAA